MLSSSVMSCTVFELLPLRLIDVLHETKDLHRQIQALPLDNGSCHDTGKSRLSVFPAEDVCLCAISSYRETAQDRMYLILWEEVY